MSTQPRKQLGIGLAGLGLIGKAYLPVLLSDERVGAIHIATREDVQLRNQRITLHNDYSKLPSLDAIIIALPAELHLDAATELSTRAGALLIEKPLAPTLREAREIAALTEDTKIMVGLLGKYHPEFRAMYDNLGAIGHLLAVNEELHEANPGLARYISGGRGVLVNNGLHTMDRFNRIARMARPQQQLRVRRVTLGNESFNADGDDSARGQLQLGCVPFRFNMSYRNSDVCDNGKRIEYVTTVAGTKGKLVVIGWEKCELFTSKFDDAQTLFTYGTPLEQDSQYSRMERGLNAQINEFLGFVKRNERTHETLQEALDAQQLVEESYQAARK